MSTVEQVHVIGGGQVQADAGAVAGDVLEGMPRAVTQPTRSSAAPG